MMDKVRMGVIGCGGVTLMAHLPNILQNEKVELIALCDINNNNLEKAKLRSGIKKTYQNYHQMLEKESLDAVIIKNKQSLQLRLV